MDDMEKIKNKLRKSKTNIHLYNQIDKIENIIIDTNLPIEKRIYNFFMQINNPYVIKVGNVIVEMEFSDDSNINPMECIDNALINDYKSRKMSRV